MELAELSKRLKDCGVVGAGGAGFPAYAKLSDKAETIILNCAECEPLFRVHRQLLSKYTLQIMTALKEIKEAVGAKEVIIAVKPSYKNAVRAVEYMLDRFDGFRIHKLSEAYPVGDEVVTIYESTGKLIAPGKIPITQGIILFNVETMLNAYNAITKNYPVCSKHVTIAGAVKNPITVRVPVGITFEEAVSFAGGAVCENAVYINGGVMTGRLGNPNDVITKTTNAIIVLPSEHPVIMKRKAKTETNIQRAMSICCQCQSCTDLCSRNLLGYPIQPHLVMRAAAKGMTNDTKACLNSFFCSSCGLCEMYSCPQDLSPRSIIATLKSRLTAEGVKAPTEPEFMGVSEIREYRKIPEARLIARLGIEQYENEAKLDVNFKYKPERVKIKLSQHIGAPAVPVVKCGDAVKRKDVIAKVPDGLGCTVHTSVCGTVSAVTAEYIMIETNI